MYLLFGCMIYSGSYDKSLDSVELPEDEEVEFGEIKIVDLQEDGDKKYSYKGDMIKSYLVTFI